MADLPQSDRTPSTSCCSGTSDLLSRAPRRSASLCTPTAGGIRKSPMCDADGHTRSSPTPDRKIGNLGTGFQTSDFRSEEHTSELQSRFDLVCRLLLEKKKINSIYAFTNSITVLTTTNAN